jgi:hypothetical protein
MKIKLERKLSSCPDSLRCTVCHELFGVGKLRSLLYNDRGLLLGDTCFVCFKKEAHEIQFALRQRGNWMMASGGGVGAQTIAMHRQALELVEISTENVEFPVKYQLWLKQLEVWMEENRESDASQFRRANWVEMKRSRLERMLERNVE